MLFKPPDMPSPNRLQGVYVSDDEIEAIVSYWKTDALKNKEAKKTSSRTKKPAKVSHENLIQQSSSLEQGKLWDLDNKQDTLLEEAIDLVRREGRASTTMLQDDCASVTPGQLE